MIETPKNLTRNILLGMFLGFVVGSLLYYVSFFSESFLEFIKVYVFNLGSAIFINLLKAFNCSFGILLFSIWYLISYQHAKFRQYNFKNNYSLFINYRYCCFSITYLLAPFLNQVQGIHQKLHHQINYQKVREYMKQF